MSVDPRSTLPDRLGVFRLPGEPVSVTADLDLLSIDPLAVTEAAWTDFTAALRSIGAGRDLLPVVGTLASMDAGELTSLPGAQDFLVLRAIRDAAVSGRWSRIVVDLSGPADAFELLRAPTVLAGTIDRLWPRHRRLAEASEKAALAQFSAAVEAIDRDCEDLRELFSDPDSSAVHLVAPAGDRGLRSVPDQLAVIDVMGLPLRSVLVNAGPGGLPTDDVAATVTARLGDGNVQVRTVDAAEDRLDRLSRIRRLGARLPEPDGEPRGSGRLKVEHVAGEGVDTVYRLSWRQGLPDPERLALGRSMDDLLVTVSGFRFPVRLPSVLQRCAVTGAEWDGERLNIEFRPDPKVWPKRAGGA